MMAGSTWPSRPSIRRAYGLLPQLGQRHLRGSYRVGRSDRATRRQESGPDRLQQRRPDGYLHLTRRLAELPIRQSLLRNNGDGTFTDVTKQAGLLEPVNSTNSSWADYDNDGWLDVYILNETATNRLYHNRRDGTFEEVAPRPGVAGDPKRFARAPTGSTMITTITPTCSSTIFTADPASTITTATAPSST